MLHGFKTLLLLSKFSRVAVWIIPATPAGASFGGSVSSILVSLLLCCGNRDTCMRMRTKMWTSILMYDVIDWSAALPWSVLALPPLAVVTCMVLL